jgi:outer membrane lipoprotein-sorting protein
MNNQDHRGGPPPWKVMAPLLAALLLLTWPGGGQAAEFSAKMVLTDGGKVMPGKVYVKGDKMRQEFTDERGQSITIVRKDRKVIWVVMPQHRVYVEMPLRKELPGQFLQLPEETLKRQKVCSETVSGYATERYQVTVSGGAAGPVIQNFWMCDQLGMPVKMECKEKNLSVEYQDIKEGAVEDKLFEPPPGLKKITKTTGVP